MARISFSRRRRLSEVSVVSAIELRGVTNQSPPLIPSNFYDSDPTLAAMLEGTPVSVVEELRGFGAAAGSAEVFELGHLANRNPPVLRTHDPQGRRIDAIDFHPAFHALMRRSLAAGLAGSIWNAQGEEAAVRSLVRGARLFMAAPADVGHLADVSSTNAAVAALGHSQDLMKVWVPGLVSRRYDQSQQVADRKSGLTVGLAITEKQAGSDFESLATEAHESANHHWLVRGHKWFVSAPHADGHVVLAQTVSGLTAFLVPRWRPDGSRNAVTLVRLKAPLGHRSGAIAEAEYADALAWVIGEPGQGMAAIADMLALMRLDDVLVAAGSARFALAQAVNHGRHRRVAGIPLIDQPLMTRVLADIGLDVVASVALAFRLAESYDRADSDPAQAAYARLMTPVSRYWTIKVAPAVVAECMDCIGGNAFVEDGGLARHSRDVAGTAMRLGGGNAMCIDTVRMLRRSSELLEEVLAGIEVALGRTAQSSLNILRAAAAVALADEGSSRIFVEQLAMTAAAAVLRQRFPSVVSDAFVETRLTKPWRVSYGMLDSRFDSKSFLNYALPGARR